MGEFLSGEELMIKKLDLLRKLGELKQLGVKLSQNYSMDSDIKMMEYEYKLHHDIRAKQNSVQWMSHMLIGLIKGGEMLNDNCNPFDIKLSGLSNKVNEDMSNYYDVMGEIYEKYHQPGKPTAPELRLLFMLSGAALKMQVDRGLETMTGGSGGSGKEPEDDDEEYMKALRRKAMEEKMKREGTAGKNINKNVNVNKGNVGEYERKLHEDATKQARDLQMIFERKLEADAMKRESGNNKRMDRIKRNLMMSTEEPPEQMEQEDEVEERTKDEIEYMKRLREERERENMKRLNVAKMAAKERQNKLLSTTNTVNNTRDRKNNQHYGASESKKLNNVLNGLYGDESTGGSSRSTVSFNPKMAKIMEDTRGKNTKHINTRMNNDLGIDLDKIVGGDTDEYSREEISVGSSKDSKNKKNIDRFEISVGSNKKGVKNGIKIGK